MTNERSLYDRLIYPSSESELSAARNAAWSEIERLRAALLKYACHCGPTDPDPAAHREDCEYRVALSCERSAAEPSERPCHFRAFGRFPCELQEGHAGSHVTRIPEGQEIAEWYVVNKRELLEYSGQRFGPDDEWSVVTPVRASSVKSGEKP